jgi:lysozyme family protein
MGYTATGTIDDLTNQLSSYETYGKIALLVIGALGLVVFYRKRKSLNS